MQSPFANPTSVKDILISFQSHFDVNSHATKELIKRKFKRQIYAPPSTQRSFVQNEVMKKKNSHYNNVAGILFTSYVKKVSWFDGKSE
jgi:hypothetical protein